MKKKVTKKVKQKSPNPVISKETPAPDKNSIPQSTNISTREKSKPEEKPKMCLRIVDASTHIMSDNPLLKPVPASKKEKLPKGYVRLDASTVIKEP